MIAKILSIKKPFNLVRNEKKKLNNKDNCFDRLLLIKNLLIKWDNLKKKTNAFNKCNKKFIRKQSQIISRYHLCQLYSACLFIGISVQDDK